MRFDDGSNVTQAETIFGNYAMESSQLLCSRVSGHVAASTVPKARRILTASVEVAISRDYYWAILEI